MIKKMEEKRTELIKSMKELKVEYSSYNGADGEIGRAFIYKQLDKISAQIELLNELIKKGRA